MNSATGRMSNAMESGAEAAREAFADTRESMGEARDAMQKAARETLREAKTYGRKNAARAYDAAQDTAKSILDYVNEKPVQAALIGLGGLLLAGLLLRRR